MRKEPNFGAVIDSQNTLELFGNADLQHTVNICDLTVKKC